MISADHLQVLKTQRNIQRLEQSLLERSASFPSLSSIAEELHRIEPPVQCPATPLKYMDSPPPTIAPTPEGGSPIISKRYLLSPPPVAGNEGCPFQIRNRPNCSPSPPLNPLRILIGNFSPGASGFPPPHPIQFCPDPGYQPIGSQPQQSPGILGAWPLNEPSGYHSDDAVSYEDNESLFEGWVDGEPGTASGIYDLIQDDDGYILSDSTLSSTNENPTTVCASKHTKTLSRSDSVILAKYASSCTDIHCTICKGLSSQLRNPEWRLDLGTSAYFTPVFLDFITFTQFKEPLRVNTVSSPLAQYGFGTVLLQYLIYSKKGKESIKILCIHDVLFVPHITQRILSLGDFLNQGMHIYGDMHCITLMLLESNTLVFQCGLLSSSEKLFWLRASSVTPTLLNLVYKEDYELMHHHMGHPLKDVMRCALQNTKGFPNLNFPRSEPLCPGCA